MMQLRGLVFRRLLRFLLITTWLGGCGDARNVEGDGFCNGNDCQCPSTGDCRIDCGDACDLSCTGSGDCAFSCGLDCLPTCPGSGQCDIATGDEGQVVCAGSGGCNVTCLGDCTVECPGSGLCTVECQPGFDCELTRCEDALSCPNGVQVCNGVCPK
jgi:hypothetical protein